MTVCTTKTFSPLTLRMIRFMANRSVEFSMVIISIIAFYPYQKMFYKISYSLGAT